MSDGWLEKGDGFTFDEFSAERAADDHAFVITSFGPQPDAKRVFSAIKAARQFGMIRLRVTADTQPAIDTLTRDGMIRCVQTIGTEHPELGVMAIKTG